MHQQASARSTSKISQGILRMPPTNFNEYNHSAFAIVDFDMGIQRKHGHYRGIRYS